MRTIIIVDAFSTGHNYIADIVSMGYTPIVLETKQGSAMEWAQDIYKAIPYDFEIISEQDSYEDTVALCKKYDPLLIIPGSESGVEIATRVAESLGLIGNPSSILDKMKSKAAMQEAVKAAGLRYIKGKIVTTPEEAEAFLQENNLTMGVVKPVDGAGSMGVAICDTVEQVLDAVRKKPDEKDIFNRPITNILVQERIVGKEYVVNTVSSNGKHRVTSMFAYDKVKTEKGGHVYKNGSNITELEAKHKDLIQYALKTADAIGIKYGPIHGEYMLDEKGPVLIEVNCRPMGCTMPAGFVDLMYGQHETDSSLEAYLMPEKFEEDAKKPYKALRAGNVKTIIIPNDIEAESIPLWTIAENLRSTYKISLPEKNRVMQFAKTEDLETAGGTIFLVHDKEEVVRADSELLGHLEDNYFSLLYSEGTSRPWFVRGDITPKTTQEIINDNHLMGTILSVEEKKEEVLNVQTVLPKDIDGVHSSFANVIININESLVSMKETEALDLIFKAMKLVKENGKVVIPKSTYEYLSYKKSGAEELLKILGYESCITNSENYVIGRRPVNV